MFAGVHPLSREITRHWPVSWVQLLLTRPCFTGYGLLHDLAVGLGTRAPRFLSRCCPPPYPRFPMRTHPLERPAGVAGSIMHVIE